MISPVDKIFSALIDTTPPSINRIAKIESNGSNFSIRRTKPPNAALIASPNPIGKITTCTIDSIIAVKDTSSHAPASNNVKVGVTSGASKVVVIVIETDNATSPRAIQNTVLHDPG